ncbi:purine-binding chemotaxis protein CheW [Sphingomonas zeicaulis]|uniref:chemotaxis protein CheW n=1 Tax=Sphingomonas zeicaulis TaxID=1632740 RepID=UPI003D24740E
MTIRAAGQTLALPASSVREVTRLPRLTRVPQAPPALMGLASLRGDVVPVISLSSLLGKAPGTPTRVVVIERDDPIGLAVDAVEKVGEVGRLGTQTLDLDPLLGSVFAGSQRAVTRGWARVRGAAAAASRSTAVPLLAFLAGVQDFALPLRDVEEVLPVPDRISALPDADRAVLGTATLRDTLLPLLSASALLGFGTSHLARRSRVIVLRIGRHRIGLMADAVHGTLHVEPDNIDPVPQVLARGSAEARIQAICRLDHGRRLVSVLATEHLLRDDLTTRLLQGRGGEHAAEERMSEEASAPILLFRIGDASYGLPLEAVEEVARLPDRLTRLPRAPAFVEGVMNVRGMVVPVIDQARRFAGVPAAGARRRVIVVAIGEMRVGFLVDGVDEILRVPSTAIQPTPNLGADDAQVFDRVASLDGSEQVVLIVSPRDLLDLAERDLIAALAREPAAAS